MRKSFKRKLLYKVVIFAHKKYSYRFKTLKLNHCFLYYLSGPWKLQWRCFLCMGAFETSWIPSKIS